MLPGQRGWPNYPRPDVTRCFGRRRGEAARCSRRRRRRAGAGAAPARRRARRDREAPDDHGPFIDGLAEEGAAADDGSPSDIDPDFSIDEVDDVGADDTEAARDALDVGSLSDAVALPEGGEGAPDDRGPRGDARRPVAVRRPVRGGGRRGHRRRSVGLRRRERAAPARDGRRRGRRREHGRGGRRRAPRAAPFDPRTVAGRGRPRRGRAVLARHRVRRRAWWRPVRRCSSLRTDRARARVQRARPGRRGGGARARDRRTRSRRSARRERRRDLRRVPPWRDPRHLGWRRVVGALRRALGVRSRSARARGHAGPPLDPRGRRPLPRPLALRSRGPPRRGDPRAPGGRARHGLGRLDPRGPRGARRRARRGAAARGRRGGSGRDPPCHDARGHRRRRSGARGGRGRACDRPVRSRRGAPLARRRPHVPPVRGRAGARPHLRGGRRPARA